ncbi:hypothetical protein MPTK1_5g21940 [Marchantia polymorpha subsp. ruderalis]|uniref:Uncharacterized protein n=2 Tax=Marchantia polymorpha TaxID=3197 RepID=A0AAF6BKY5_MARPO|nr:hypothetical protein MARPO_0106s0005 [Marchantia polymorpha]BBN12669.1 hypothetical protein Mp_5g21940 [Marchantia polymorpha subsp. ruderalis]|eukprot:PTQ31799.1 hypothetical protein MARPO_0106s0005 [Marchantia polymorpha]
MACICPLRSATYKLPTSQPANLHVKWIRADKVRERKPTNTIDCLVSFQISPLLLQRLDAFRCPNGTDLLEERISIRMPPMTKRFWSSCFFQQLQEGNARSSRSQPVARSRFKLEVS